MHERSVVLLLYADVTLVHYTTMNQEEEEDKKIIIKKFVEKKRYFSEKDKTNRKRSTVYNMKVVLIYSMLSLCIIISRENLLKILVYVVLVILIYLYKSVYYILFIY